MTAEMSDSEIEFGNILVLKKDSNLKLSDVKRLTRARTVRLLKETKDMTTVDLLYRNITYACNYLKMCGDNYCFVKIYQLDGDIASTLLSIQTPDFLAAICLSTQQFKSLHNAVVTKINVDNLKIRLKQLIIANAEFLDLLGRQKNHKSHFMNVGKKFEKIDGTYCTTLATESVETMTRIMKTTW